MLLNQCPHNLDLWQWICGMPKKLRAECRIGHYHNIDVEDDVTILAEYENGAQAVFLTSTGEYPGTNRLEISGTKGKAVVENGMLSWYLLSEDEQKTRFETKEGLPKLPLQKEVLTQTEPETAHCGILQNFTDVILARQGDGTNEAGASSPSHPAVLLSPGEEGIYELMLSNAAYLSADRGGEWVELPPDGEAFCRLLKRRQEQETDREKKLSGEILSGTYSDRWRVKW